MPSLSKGVFRVWDTMLIVVHRSYNKDNKSCEWDSMGHKIPHQTALRVLEVFIFQTQA